MTEIERQALDALVAWRRTKLTVRAIDMRDADTWASAYDRFEVSETIIDALDDRLIVEREAR